MKDSAPWRPLSDSERRRAPCMSRIRFRLDASSGRKTMCAHSPRTGGQDVIPPDFIPRSRVRTSYNYVFRRTPMIPDAESGRPYEILRGAVVSRAAGGCWVVRIRFKPRCKSPGPPPRPLPRHSWREFRLYGLNLGSVQLFISALYVQAGNAGTLCVNYEV